MNCSEKIPQLAVTISQPSNQQLTRADRNIPIWRLVWALKAFQAPVTCGFQQVFSLKGTNLLAATTHLKELSRVPVFRLKSDIWQVIPQRSITGRASRSLVSLFPNCTGDKAYASWMTNSPACPIWSFPLGYSSALKKAAVKHRTWYTEILRHWVG